MSTGRIQVEQFTPIRSREWGNILWDQSVNVFDDANDRDIQWPTPKPGAMSFLESTGRLSVYAGGRWWDVGLRRLGPASATAFWRSTTNQQLNSTQSTFINFPTATFTFVAPEWADSATVAVEAGPGFYPPNTNADWGGAYRGEYNTGAGWQGFHGYTWTEGFSMTVQAVGVGTRGFNGPTWRDVDTIPVTAGGVLELRSMMRTAQIVGMPHLHFAANSKVHAEVHWSGQW